MKNHIIIAIASLMTITSCSDGVMNYLNKDTSNPADDVVQFSLCFSLFLQFPPS